MTRILALAFLTLWLVNLSACQQEEANTMTSSAATDIKTEQIEYEANGVKLNGYISWDANQTGPRPGVLVVHEWWGQTDYIRLRARMLAGLGYTGFAVDMYGNGKTASHPDEAGKFMTEILNNMDEGAARFEAARTALKSHASADASKTAAIGYCFGGAVVLEMARRGMDLKGVASFHGNLSTQTKVEPGSIKAKILVLHGDDDVLIPQEQVDAFKSEMLNARAEMKFLGYPGALHGFTNPAATENGKRYGLPLAYNKSVDKESWNELKQFLGEIFSD
ncbi:MAG: dienelactone hydrolase family protein [Burkholderiales bacterium]|nr:dienelactone hydrolase family protein [Burkholderiales bacterium]